MFLTHRSGRALSGCSGVSPSAWGESEGVLEKVWVSGSCHPAFQGSGPNLPYSDSGTPSPPTVRSYGPIATRGSVGLAVPTPAHFSISDYGGDSGERVKSGDRGEWRVREGSGKRAPSRGTQMMEGGERAEVCFSVLLGPGPGDGIRRWNRAAGQRRQVPGCPGQAPPAPAALEQRSAVHLPEPTPSARRSSRHIYPAKNSLRNALPISTGRVRIAPIERPLMERLGHARRGRSVSASAIGES